MRGPSGALRCGGPVLEHVPARGARAQMRVEANVGRVAEISREQSLDVGLGEAVAHANSVLSSLAASSFSIFVTLLRAW